MQRCNSSKMHEHKHKNKNENEHKMKMNTDPDRETDNDRDPDTDIRISRHMNKPTWKSAFRANFVIVSLMTALRPQLDSQVYYRQ
jgi:hypothetical protein